MLRQRAIVTAIAIERFRRDTSKLPQQLDELVTGYLDRVPVDPFTGMPIDYVIQTSKYALHALGDEFTDTLDDPNYVFWFESPITN